MTGCDKIILTTPFPTCRYKIPVKPGTVLMREKQLQLVSPRRGAYPFQRSFFHTTHREIVPLVQALFV